VQPKRSILVDVVETYVGRGRVSAGMVVTNLSFKSGGLIVYGRQLLTNVLAK
jgi:hypothetical protein